MSTIRGLLRTELNPGVAAVLHCTRISITRSPSGSQKLAALITLPWVDLEQKSQRYQ